MSKVKKKELRKVLKKAMKIYRGAIDEADVCETLLMELRNQKAGYAPPVEEVGWGFLSSQLLVSEVPAALELGLIVKTSGRKFYDRFRGRYIYPVKKEGKLASMIGLISSERGMKGLIIMLLPPSRLCDWNEDREARSKKVSISEIMEHVNLKRKGRVFLGLCPFHEEKTPSFTVEPKTGMFHCFGCGASGDFFDFMQRINNK